jgi:hypothetical protein
MNYNNNMSNMQSMPMSNMPMQNMPMSNMPMQNMPMQNMPMQNMPMSNMSNMPMNSMGSVNTTYNPHYIPEVSTNISSNNVSLKKNIDLETFKNKPQKKKIYWIYIVKAIACYTLLFMVMNHINMDTMICKCIPFIADNVVLSTVIKGVIMSIFILIIQIFLK